jgi:hypothetical protein
MYIDCICQNLSKTNEPVDAFLCIMHFINSNGCRASRQRETQKKAVEIEAMERANRTWSSSASSRGRIAKEIGLEC